LTSVPLAPPPLQIMNEDFVSKLPVLTVTTTYKNDSPLLILLEKTNKRWCTCKFIYWRIRTHNVELCSEINMAEQEIQKKKEYPPPPSVRQLPCWTVYKHKNCQWRGIWTKFPKSSQSQLCAIYKTSNIRLPCRTESL